MKSFDKVIAAKMRDELNAALESVAKKYDVSVHVGNCTFSDIEMNYKLNVKTNDKGAMEEKNRKEWNSYCELYGFQKDDLGKKFMMNGKEYTIEGFALNRSKFNLKGTSVRDGRKMLFPSDNVAKQLHPTKMMHEEFGTKKCKYCGKSNGSKNANLLCKECQETFGHTYFTEL